MAEIIEIANSHTKSPTFKPLSVKQERAICLVLQGRNDEEVANQVGVERETVCRWRRHHPVFKSKLEDERARLWESSVSRLAQVVSIALEVIEKRLQDENEKGRLAAAMDILRIVEPKRTGGWHLDFSSPREPLEIIKEHARIADTWLTDSLQGWNDSVQEDAILDIEGRVGEQITEEGRRKKERG